MTNNKFSKLFADKVVWITGASSGIGEAFAEAFHAAGARLILSALTEEELKPVSDRLIGSKAIAFDVADFDALPEVVTKAQAFYGKIDVLVNNAGITQRDLARDTDFSVYQRIVDIDLMAPIALTQLVMPRMIERGSGRVIAIASISGKLGAPLRTAYSAAKHGIFGYFDALRAEVQHEGIDIHVIAPGSVKTNLARNALTGEGAKFGKTDSAIENGYAPAELINRIFNAIAKGKREIIIARGTEKLGIVLRRYAPEVAFDRIAAATPRIIRNIKEAQ